MLQPEQTNPLSVNLLSANPALEVRGDVPRGWVGCPSFDWVVPAAELRAGHPTLGFEGSCDFAGGCVISQKPMNSHLPANNHTSCEIARAACPPGSSGRTKYM